VIGCRQGAVPDVVRDGQDGVLVPFRDANALAEAILSLLDNSEMARGMGLAGQARVRERFSWSSVAVRFRESYARAIERHASMAA
jgi:glycosyltransferase involved in cell wall biosynthesis